MKSATALPLAAFMYVARADHSEDSGSHAQPAVNCRNDICFSAVVPEATAASGSGGVYFQIYAPDTFAWVGLGTGTTMADANIFLIYQNGEGNVTLSNRQTTGHNPPTVPENGAELELLDGSGVSDGFMVANFRCDNCESWKNGDGEADFSGEVAMIGAWQEGDPLDSTDVEESITKHTGSPRIFSLDLSSAQVNSTGNPFVGDLAVPASDSGEEGGGEDNPDAGIGRFALTSGSAALAILSTTLSLLL
jgi:hypothetical protein